ncbi:hypothetical protein A2U01_0020152 [Trifolium medium]|uniref:Uncharacterized protein n=1 Tax=Trifolium medium TaxID=97028 RepID=A0A392NI54_9FABA|nr:hypothetical protein [Trifolium medium]
MEIRIERSNQQLGFVIVSEENDSERDDGNEIHDPGANKNKIDFQRFIVMMRIRDSV